jgi:hypothetical protein
MGAQSFIISGHLYGRTIEQCFDDARGDRSERGYTGTIAEKDTFVMMPPIESKTLEASAWQYIDDEDPRINEKYGPAGCVQDGQWYCFFGWASA